MTQLQSADSDRGAACRGGRRRPARASAAPDAVGRCRRRGRYRLPHAAVAAVSRLAAAADVRCGGGRGRGVVRRSPRYRGTADSVRGRTRASRWPAYGLWQLFRADGLREYRFIAVTFVAQYALFVVTAGRPYYLAGLYAPLAAAGALGLQRRREAGTHRRWLAWIGGRDERRACRGCACSRPSRSAGRMSASRSRGAPPTPSRTA